MSRQSGKKLILEYLKQHLGEWVSNQELRNVSGSEGNDTPRTVRGLRQEGWPIEVDGKGNVRLLSLEKGPARGIRAGISEKQRDEVFSRDGFRCRVCGRSATNGVKLQVDHIIPIDWGGKTELDNLQTLCGACNRGKKSWTSSVPSATMKLIMAKPTVEARIEALFDSFPNQDVPSTLIQLVST